MANLSDQIVKIYALPSYVLVLHHNYLRKLMRYQLIMSSLNLKTVFIYPSTRVMLLDPIKKSTRCTWPFVQKIPCQRKISCTFWERKMYLFITYQRYLTNLEVDDLIVKQGQDGIFLGQGLGQIDMIALMFQPPKDKLLY